MDIIKQGMVRVKRFDGDMKSQKCLFVKDLLVKYMVDNAVSISDIYIGATDDRDVDITTDVSPDLIRDLNNVPNLNCTVEERLEYIVRAIDYEHGIRISVRIDDSYDNENGKDGRPVLEHDKVIITIHV
jgi:hypothetical protein